MMLLSTTIVNSQSATSDTLVYTPVYLMNMLMSDLERCDLDRIELKKAKAELSVLYVENAKAVSANKSLQDQLKSLRQYNDSLVADNLNLTVTSQARINKLKKTRNFWFRTTLLGAMTSVGIHYNWKESWIKVK